MAADSKTVAHRVGTVDAQARSATPAALAPIVRPPHSPIIHAALWLGCLTAGVLGISAASRATWLGGAVEGASPQVPTGIERLETFSTAGVKSGKGKPCWDVIGRRWVPHGTVAERMSAYGPTLSATSPKGRVKCIDGAWVNHGSAG